MDGDRIIVYDGVCHLCAHAVRYIKRNDADAKFKLVPSQSGRGQELLQRYGINPQDLDTVLLITDKGVFYRSDAVLEIAHVLDSLAPFSSILRMLPQKLRNRWYTRVAKNRYRWFGKTSHGHLSSGDQSDRFLD